MNRMRRARRILVLVGLLLIGSGCALSSCTKGLVYRYRIKAGLRSPAPLDPAKPDGPRLDLRDNIPVLHVYGTPREMGTQYGTVLKRPLRALDGYIHAMLPSRTIEGYLAQADALEPNLPPEVREELHAVAEASGLEYRNLVALNAIPRMRCSALAVWDQVPADGRLIWGRNADYFGMGLSDRGGLVVVYHPDRGEPVLAVNFLGMIGAFTGMNGKGVAFGNMLVFNPSVRGRNEDGVAVQLLMRQAAHRAGSAQGMADELLKMRHVIPINVMVADAKEALVLELGINGSAVRRGSDGVLAVSNDFLTEGLRADVPQCARYRALADAAAANRGSFDVEAMKKALYAARLKNLNLQAVVVEPAAMRIHIAMNRVPASAGPYVLFDLNELFR